jgi:hypothetical protein
VLTSRHGERTNLTFRASHSVALVFLGLTLIGLAIVLPRLLLVAMLDAAAAAVIVVPPILAGLCLVPFFGLGQLPIRWHLLLGASLGLGITSLLVLSLGLAGVLQRVVWIGVLGMFTVVGIIRLRGLSTLAASWKGDEQSADRQTQTHELHWLWLVLVPFLILALLAAANAPGFIWAEEGNGYDVLEYHLQMPKEYFQAGRVAYAPHNVYANFPMNVEMLYLLAMIVHNEVYDLGTTANMIHLILGALIVYAAWVVGREWSPRAGQVIAIAMGTVGWLGYLSGLAYVEHGMLFFSTTAVAALLRAIARPAHGVSRGWLALSGVCSGFACGCKYTAIPFTAFVILLVMLFWLRGNWRRRVLNLSVYLLATATSFAPWLIKNELMTGNPIFPLANGLFNAQPPGWGAKESEQWHRGHSLTESDRALGARLGALWRYVPADVDQRFGPAILLLALGGLLGRRLERTDLLLLTMLVIQVLFWLFATHLYARFTVSFLIPLSILAGRAVLAGRIRHRMWIAGSVLLTGGAWNFAFAAKLHDREAPGGAPASLIYDGTIPGLEYFAVINHELPANAKVLVVGDAKAFYFQRKVDYCVAFNRSSFVEIVEGASNANDIMRWLRERGYTHVIVHWNEIARLTRTYGFSPLVTPQLFDRLAAAGLRRLREFRHPDVSGRWVELYEVPFDKGVGVR